MKIKSIFLAVFSLITIFIFQNCNNVNEEMNSNNPLTEDMNVQDPTKSRIQFKLVDAPDDNYLQVWVDIIDFQYQRDEESGWVSFDNYPVNSGDNMVDLTELIAGTSHVLADEEIEPGLFSKVRIVLGDNNYLMIEGEEEGEMIRKDLKTPSAQQSGLKLHVETDLQAGFSYTFVLDWDVQKSIVKAGNSGIYNLKPVIRAHTEINAGDITGMVYEAFEGSDDMPLEGVMVEVFDMNNLAESVTTTYTNELGAFLVSTLPVGNYKLLFTYSSLEYVYDDVEVMDVQVIKDETTDVGVIYMKKSTGWMVGRVADILETEAGAEEMPLEGATIMVYAKDGAIETYITETTSDSMGEFMVEELLPGTYVVKVMMNGYLDGESDMFDIVINTETNIGTIHLHKNVGSIIGIVADAAEGNDPLEGALVKAFFIEDDSSETFIKEVTTDAEGNFMLDDLTPGEYNLKVTLTGYDENSKTETVEFNVEKDTGTILLTATP